MYEVRRAIAGALCGAGLLAGAGCSSTESEPAPGYVPAIMPVIENMQVACVDVGDLPKFTDESCAQLASGVEAGLQDFSRMTDNTIPPPRDVSYRLYPRTVAFDHALATRCTDLSNTTDAAFQNLEKMVFTIRKTAIKEAGVDFTNGGLFIGVNAPEELCPQQLQPTVPAPVEQKTERCPENDPNKKTRYGTARALLEQRAPVILGFANTDKKWMEHAVSHERGHLGFDKTRLGHEAVFCAFDDQELPTTIGSQQSDIGVDVRSSRGSLMSYTDDASYLSPTDLVALGVIKDDKIVTADTSGTFTLSDAGGEGPAALQLDRGFSNPAIKRVLGEYLVAGELPLKDYRLWVGKMPDRASVGVYVAPVHGKEDDVELPTTFLVDELVPGKTINIEGDLQLRVGGSSKEAVTVQLQLP